MCDKNQEGDGGGCTPHEGPLTSYNVHTLRERIRAPLNKVTRELGTAHKVAQRKSCHFDLWDVEIGLGCVLRQWIARVISHLSTRMRRGRGRPTCLCLLVPVCSNARPAPRCDARRRNGLPAHNEERCARQRDEIPITLS